MSWLVDARLVDAATNWSECIYEMGERSLSRNAGYLIHEKCLQAKEDGARILIVIGYT